MPSHWIIIIIIRYKKYCLLFRWRCWKVLTAAAHTHLNRLQTWKTKTKWESECNEMQLCIPCLWFANHDHHLVAQHQSASTYAISQLTQLNHLQCEISRIWFKFNLFFFFVFFVNSLKLPIRRRSPNEAQYYFVGVIPAKILFELDICDRKHENYHRHVHNAHARLKRLRYMYVIAINCKCTLCVCVYYTDTHRYDCSDLRCLI